MRSRAALTVAAVSAAALLAVVATMPAVATGATSGQGVPGESRDLRQLPLTGPDGQRGGFRPADLDPDRVVTVLLEVAGEPVAQAQAEALDEGAELSDGRRAELRDTLQDRQARVRSGVEALDGDVVSAMQDAFNGLKVRLAQSDLDEVSALPGVVAVHPVPVLQRRNAGSVPLLDIPQQVWEQVGATGQGVSIGIIDTGIDYTHAAFGGPGTVEAYQENDPAVLEEGTFPTAKVVGGYDFVGNTYNALARPGDPALLPDPDPDPLDCHGHGTHVAGTAAGAGVLADGSTYAGPYGSSTYDHEFLVGPGVAPEASLYALKVFGCTGATDMVVEAVDWAVANDLDVINLSLGSEYSVLGNAGVAALDHAAAAGTIPVVAAGNSGDISYITGSPGTALRSLSVAAVDMMESFPSAVVGAGQAQVQLQVSNAPGVADPVSGPLVLLHDDAATLEDDSKGCLADDYAGVPDGAVVVTFRGKCPRVDRAVLGQQAGAAAVVMVNDAPGLPPLEGPIDGATIPFLGATPEHGEQLAELAGQVVTVTDAGLAPNRGFRAPAGFSSAGPALVGDAAKPDLAAPGVGIVSAAAGTGWAAALRSGTSMAAPYVAGVAALVRQVRPDAAVETVTAAIVNTADPEETVDYRALRLGTGLVDPDQAIRTPVVALGDPGTASLSFGFVESGSTVTERRTVTLHNTSPEPVSFTASVQPSSEPDGGASVSVRPESVTVPGSEQVQVEVSVTVSPSPGPPAQGLQAASGTVVFTPVAGDGAVTLRVPYLLVFRAVSAMWTWPPVVFSPRDGVAEFTTWNFSPVPGAADVYAWGARDPRGDDLVAGGSAPDLRSTGVQAFPELVPFPDEPEARGIGLFAVDTHERLATASTAVFDVRLDVDEDGHFDFQVIGVDIGRLTSDRPTGEFAAVTYDLDSGEPLRSLPAGGGTNSSAVTLPFLLSDVGVNAANPDFQYDVASFSLLAAGLDEVDGRAAFDAFDQPVETGQYLQVDGWGSAAWTAAVDREELRQTPVLGWLVLHPQNRPSTGQAQRIWLVGGRR